MSEHPIDRPIVDTIVQLAAERGVAVADVSIKEMARGLGISRMTLYRRIGSRAALLDAIRAAGGDPGDRPGVRERAVVAAAEIVREKGLRALTLEAVATRARCSIPALHSQLGGRRGLLTELFERYSPLPEVERALSAAPHGLDSSVRAIYGAIYDTLTAEPRLLRALIAELLHDPEGELGCFVREWYLPRVLGSVGRWLMKQVEGGRVQPWPLPLLIQQLVAPLALHVISRSFIEEGLGVQLPPRDEVIASFAAAFCRAVEAQRDDEQSVG